MNGGGPGVNRSTGACDQTAFLDIGRFSEKIFTVVEDNGDHGSIHSRRFTRQEAEH